MNALGKYCHDFPRLAKESGYKFQLYRGRINWSDLEDLNIQEIIDDRNFKLLEDNLINVINCNLEREYDVKILDQNFVKLFRLAQLGIDYLSYCELYLDRCVILLQEQLSFCQEECVHLKEENARKDEEIRRSRKKVKIQSQNFKCNQCEKVFLSEAYLKSHEKRRHRRELDQIKNVKNVYMDQSQQTDKELISNSVFTQTSVEKNVMEFATDTSETVKVKEQEVKIDQLKRDLDELKIRLSLAEKAMGEKRMDENSFQSKSGFPNSVIPVIYSNISPSSSGYVTMNSSNQGVVQGSQLFIQEEELPKTIDKCQERESTVFTNLSPNKFVEDTKKVFKEIELEVKTVEPKKGKPKRLFEVEEPLEIVQTEISPIVSLTDLRSESSCESLYSRTSTPLKTVLVKESKADRKSRSDDVLVQSGPKSLLRQLVGKKSPNIQKLTVNLRNSFSQLYSMAGRKSAEVEEMDLPNSKSAVLEGLNGRLRSLGIDPDWTGIPKETMKQKMNIIEHHRNLLTKENRLYPFLRKKIDKHIIRKLKSNSRAMFQPSSESVAPHTTEMESNVIGIIDSDGEGGPKSSDDVVTPEAVNQAKEKEERKTDLSIFQAKAKPKEPETQKRNTIDELQTDSDFDDNFLGEFEEQSLQTINQHINGDALKNEVIGSFPEKDEDQHPVPAVRKSKQDNQSILKTESEGRSQAAKKKVLFAEQPEIRQTNNKPDSFRSSLETAKAFDLISTLDDDDDSWSIESEWNAIHG